MPYLICLDCFANLCVFVFERVGGVSLIQLKLWLSCVSHLMRIVSIPVVGYLVSTDKDVMQTRTPTRGYAASLKSRMWWDTLSSTISLHPALNDRQGTRNVEILMDMVDLRNH